MKLTNKLNYPPAYCEAAKYQIYRSKPDRIGVTSLIGSPQVRRLVIERFDDIVLDIEDFFTPMLGISFHFHLQKNCPEGYIAEAKWEHLIGDLTLVGKADIVDNSILSEIDDYKLISGWSWTFDKGKTYAEQLNCLNWLRVKNGGEVAKHLRVHAFIKDWSKYQAERSSNYPQQRYMCVDIPIWPLEKTERFINHRLALHKNKDYQCTDEDKWVRIEKFAIMREGRKSSLRNLDSFAEAEKYILDNNLTQEQATGKVYIEERKSEPRCCLEYCTARSVCDYAKSLRI